MFRARARLSRFQSCLGKSSRPRLTRVLATCVRPRIIQESPGHKVLSSYSTGYNWGVFGRVWQRACALATVAVKRLSQAIRRALEPTAGLVIGNDPAKPRDSDRVSSQHGYPDPS